MRLAVLDGEIVCPCVSATPKSQNVIPVTATVGQRKMAAAGWYERHTSFCTQPPTHCRGNRDRPADKNPIISGKNNGRVAGSPFRTRPGALSLRLNVHRLHLRRRGIAACRGPCWAPLARLNYVGQVLC
jgi:hypothetical protein